MSSLAEFFALRFGVELCGDLADLIDEGVAVALLVLGESCPAAGCGRTRCRAWWGWPSRSRRRERGRRGLLVVAGLVGLDNVGHRERVNLVAGLHHLLLEIEEDLGEAGLLFGEREDGLVDHLQAERGTDAFAVRVGDVEADARVGAGLVDGGVGGGLDLQFIGGLDEDQAMVGDGLGIAAEEIGVDVERAGHLGRGVEGEVGLAVLQIEVAGEDGLAVLDDVDIGRAAGARGEDVELDAVAGLDDGAIGAEQNLVGAPAGLERNVARGAVAVVVVGFDAEGLHAVAGVEADDSHAAAIGGDLLIGRH